MSAPAPPHSVGTVMPRKPSLPISASNGRGISPAASQARTCGSTCSRANARAVSRIRLCYSLSSMALPGELGAVVLDVAAVVGGLEARDGLDHRRHALVDRERRRPAAHVGLNPARMQRDADQAARRQLLGQAVPFHVQRRLAGAIEIAAAIVV